MSTDKKKDDKKAKREVVDEVVEELSESSSEEDDMSLLGFFELKKGTKGDFKPVYGIVSAGSLFWYKDSRVRSKKSHLSAFSCRLFATYRLHLHLQSSVHSNREQNI